MRVKNCNECRKQIHKQAQEEYLRINPHLESEKDFIKGVKKNE